MSESEEVLCRVEGSVGAAYRTFIRSEQLSADGLAEISREGSTGIDEQHPYAWFGRREPSPRG